jgi:hypothetical protein
MIALRGLAGMQTHVLVLTHDRPEGLRALLASVRKQDGGGEECRIIVLDNGSASENARQAAKICHEHDARHEYSVENTFMRGKRILEDLAFAEGRVPELIVHADDDVVLGPGWLAAVTEPIQGGRFAACGSVENYQGRRVFSGQQDIRITEDIVDDRPVRVWEWEWEEVGTIKGTVPVEFAGHRALAVLGDLAAKRRHDPAYLIGGEDLDYSLELRMSAPQGLAIATSAAIQHRAGGEQDATGFRTPENVLVSWRHFYRKWGFLRRNACSEAGLTPEDFVRAVTGSGDADRAGGGRD